MGALVLFVLVLETFCLGHLLARVRDLNEENELLRESLPYYHTDDWHDVLQDSGVKDGE